MTDDSLGGTLEGNIERRLRDRVAERDARIEELLARCSEIENERRMWKSRAGTLRTLLDAALVELAVGFQKALEDSSETKDFARFVEPTFRETLALIRRVSLRADALEADAWCKAVAVARDFVREAEGQEKLAPEQSFPSTWVARWRDRFAAALKSP